MVTYQSSSASQQVLVKQKLYPTTLTLTINEAEVVEQTPFTVSGFLTYTRGATQVPLPGRLITLSIAGSPPQTGTTATTATDGSYSASLTITIAGTYTITASYAGETGLASASVEAPVSTQGAVADYTPLIVAGIGLALLYLIFGDK